MKGTLTAIIVDDERLARNDLRLMLAHVLPMFYQVIKKPRKSLIYRV